MLRRCITYAVSGVALLTTLSCAEPVVGPTGITGNLGSVSVLLTDAPGDIKSAVVTISSIYFQGQNDSTAKIFLRGIADPELTTDLVKLRNTVQEVAKNVPVPPGTYVQLRMVVTGGYIEVEEAAGISVIYATPGYPTPRPAVGVLQLPSLGLTGLKVDLAGGAFKVEGMTDQKLLIDFDVAQSFGRATGLSGWVMRPVIKGSAQAGS